MNEIKNKKLVKRIDYQTVIICLKMKNI